MKKLLSLLVIGLMSISLSACDNDKKQKTVEDVEKPKKEIITDDETKKMANEGTQLSDEEIQRLRISGFGDVNEKRTYNFTLPKKDKKDLTTDDELKKLGKEGTQLSDEEIQKRRVEGFGDLSKPQNFELVVPKL